MPKHLVVCIDGTWNGAAAGEATNVSRLFKVLTDVDGPTTQRVIYSAGVGTANRADAVAGGLWGLGSIGRVLDSYRFICTNYEPGDELSLFGFSRGAFAVRAMLGVFATIGVLQRPELARAADAVALARRRPSEETLRARTAFRRAYADDVQIRFVGVWDTVVMHGPVSTPGRVLVERALGQPFGLVDQTIPTNVRRFRHALALDEQRAAFWPWRAQRDATDPERVQEVWFAGSHADVGGGYDESRPSELALEWMAQCAAQEGLIFNRMPQAAPDAYRAPLNPSRVRGWRMLRARPRVVEKGDVVHPSVEKRMQATGYVPAARFVKDDAQAFTG